jgi:type II secretory pathway component PulF
MGLETLVGDPQLRRTLPDGLAETLRRAMRVSAPLGASLRDAAFVDDAAAALIDAGAEGGFLPRAFLAVADQLDEGIKRRRRALAALSYPAFVAIAAVVVLPLPSAVTGGVGAWAAVAVPGVSVIVAVMVGIFVVLPRSPPATQATIKRAAARVPVLGAFVTDDGRAAFLDILWRLLGAGVAVTVALPRAMNASGLALPVSADAVVDVVERGGTLAGALEKTGLFDTVSLGQIAVAEQTGSLDRGLSALSSSFQERGRRRFMAMAVAAGVVVGVACAVVVGVGVVRGYMGYFKTIEAVTAE